MVTHSQTGSATSRPRLNPFAFPSDTDFRFVILIVAVLSAALFMYQNLYFAFPANSAYSRAAYAQCFSAAQAAHPADPFALSSAYSQCVAPTDQIEAEWIALSIALLLSVAAAMYWAFPAWKIWRGGLKALSAEHAPAEIITCLSDLCHQAGLTHPPIFLLNAYSRASSGLTFGRLGRYYVVLNSGLVLQFQRDRAAFCAIVLHELGHIRNADVDKTYFTLALGWAFALVALLPWIVTLPLLQQNIAYIFDTGWRILALVILIYLTIISILRTREVYADVRASVWDGPMGALRHILGTGSRPKGNLWQRLQQTHPESKERREALDDTSSLFRLRFWMPFATGVAVSSAIINVEFTFLLLHLGQIWNNVVATGIFFAFLVVGVAGIAAWRATFATMMRGKALPGMLLVSVGLTLGLLLGQTLPLFSTYSNPNTDFGYFTDISFLSPGQFTLTSFLSQAGSLIPWSLLLLIMLFFLLRWIAVSAEAWLEVVISYASLRRSYWIGILIADVVLGILFGHFYELRLALPLFAGSSSSAALPTPLVAIIVLINSPPILFVFFCLWAYPLSAWFWRKRRSQLVRSSWAFLDPLTESERQAHSLSSQPLRPGLALLVGLGGGLAFLALLSFFKSRLLLDNFSQTMLAVSLQTAMAAIVAAWVPRLNAIHGLCSAFVTGCIAAIVMLAYSRTFDFTTALLVVNTGMVVTLPIVLIVSILARGIRRLGQRIVPTRVVPGTALSQ